MGTDSYREAPTWLFNLDGESALFQTQEGVNQAWEDGWYGPQGLAESSPLISTLEFETKRDLMDEVAGDPRYNGITLRMRMTMEEIAGVILVFEEEHGVKVE